jgi:2-oxoisovalerate dehydrogenase E2 component (dihydrolipoyl transacylase)
MSIKTIKMPDIGEGIAEVELVAWHVKVGDTVAEDQILADVMTDKATVEIPSHVSGTVLSLNASVGQVVAVGTEIIHIDTINEPLALINKDDDAIISKVRQHPGPAVGRATQESSGAMSVPDTIILSSGAHHVIAAPAVRRKARDLGVDLNEIRPTGPTGRITHADLQRHETSTKTANSNLVIDGALDQRFAQLNSEEVVPVIGLRRKIAQKMQEAKRHIPHFTYVEEIDVTELETLRAQLNVQFAPTHGKLTLLPFLMRAIVLAVRNHPEVNARYDDDANQLTRYAGVHLGIATQTASGLMVPVIRHAETLDLWASAAAVLRVSEASRNAKASREDLSGSTITLTSLGALGGIVSTPVINYPEVAIVGTNRIVERPMIKGGLVASRKMMNLSSSFDHRVVDGLNAAEFVQQIRGYLECPGTLLV